MDSPRTAGGALSGAAGRAHLGVRPSTEAPGRDASIPAEVLGTASDPGVLAVAPATAIFGNPLRSRDERFPKRP